MDEDGIQDILDKNSGLIEMHAGKTGLFQNDTAVFTALSVPEKKRLLLAVRAAMMTNHSLSGVDPDEIAQEIGIEPALAEALMREVRRIVVPRVAHRRSEEVYADLVLAASGEVEELNGLIKSLQVEVTTDETTPEALDGGDVPIERDEKAVRRKTAVVTLDPKVHLAAIKRKGEIRNEVLKAGQDLGVIYKAPEKKQTINGHFVGDMSNKDLLDQLIEATQSVEELMKLGMQDILGNPIAEKPRKQG